MTAHHHHHQCQLAWQPWRLDQLCPRPCYRQYRPQRPPRYNGARDGAGGVASTRLGQVVRPAARPSRPYLCWLRHARAAGLLACGGANRAALSASAPRGAGVATTSARPVGSLGRGFAARNTQAASAADRDGKHNSGWKAGVVGRQETALTITSSSSPCASRRRSSISRATRCSHALAAASCSACCGS